MTAWCPAPLDCSETYGRLTIGGTSLHLGAWCAFDLSALFDSPEFRGPNVLVESDAGRSARPTLTDETDYSLPMMFSGAEDPAGAAYVNPAGGLLANQRAFESTFIDPIRSGTASLAAVLRVPDPDTSGTLDFTFDVQPRRLKGWTLLPNAFARTVLEITVPVPEFVASP